MSKNRDVPLPSRRLKEFRTWANLSQSKLADLTGTSGQQIGKLEIGIAPEGRELTYEWAQRLAPFLNKKPEDFFKNEEHSSRSRDDLSPGFTFPVKEASYGGNHTDPATEEGTDMHRRTELLSIWEELDRLGKESLLNAARGQLALLRIESKGGAKPAFIKRQSK